MAAANGNGPSHLEKEQVNLQFYGYALKTVEWRSTSCWNLQ